MFQIRLQQAVILAGLFTGISVVYGLQQSQEQPAFHSNETVRATTRLVVVDVVATDSRGGAVKGLEAADFTLLENGTQQKIANFSYHHPGETASAPPRKLAPGVISNAPQNTSSSLNVLLFDLVNGDFQAHAYGKDQLLKFLKGRNVDRPLAIYAMENDLRLLHDFTVDGSALQASVEQYRIPAAKLTTQSLEGMASPFGTKGNYHADDRSIESTLNELNVLAKVLGGYPGRKNLIWLSEGFPLDFFSGQMTQTSAEMTDNKDFTGSNGVSSKTVAENAMMTSNFGEKVKKVADALMAAQVAVYPVDASALGKDSRSSSLDTMHDLASRTGGKVFAHTNDLADSLESGVSDGSAYYTVEYYPENKQWDGKFRTIQLKTSRPGVSLRYREGYYALDPEKTKKSDSERAAEDYSRILKYDAPSVTGVQFQAAVLPPSKQTGNKVLVNFGVDPHTINFSRRDDGLEHALLQCTVWAYGKDKNKPIMSNNNSTPADVKPEVYQQIMKSYFPCKQELDLSAGTYTLKLGVLDRNSNRMGTVTTNVTVP